MRVGQSDPIIIHRIPTSETTPAEEILILNTFCPQCNFIPSILLLSAIRRSTPSGAVSVFIHSWSLYLWNVYENKYTFSILINIAKSLLWKKWGFFFAHKQQSKYHVTSMGANDDQHQIRPSWHNDKSWEWGDVEWNLHRHLSLTARPKLPHDARYIAIFHGQARPHLCSHSPLNQCKVLVGCEVSVWSHQVYTRRPTKEHVRLGIVEHKGSERHG